MARTAQIISSAPPHTAGYAPWLHEFDSVAERIGHVDGGQRPTNSAAPIAHPAPSDIVIDVPDILIRDVPDDVVAALDANAKFAGQTRAEYLRRLLAGQQGPAITREQLTRFTERTADLADPEVMAAAWR
jgi:hypothetical protein